MYSPTARLLTLLELLQSRGSLSGPEIAQKLEVDVRSIRRYITMLRDIGIPVDSERGRFGYYMLRPGFRLPPLMFNDPEILAIILGLVAVRQLGLTTTPGVLSAAAKIERVLPDELRERARAMQKVMTFNMPGARSTAGETLANFSIAAYHFLQLKITYQSGSRELTERVIDAYGLVFHAGAWYAPAYCHLRHDLRVFRLDRVQESRVLETSFEAPKEFDALNYVLNSIASMPDLWHVKVLLKTSMERARHFIPGDMALLTHTPEGVLLTCYTQNLDWMVRELARLGVEVIIYQPQELRTAFQELGERLIRMSQQPMAS